jgi:dienelactone hydrolase
MIKEKFSCKRENLTIRGLKWKEKEGKLPAVILSHGFMANQSMNKAYAKLLASMGYAAFTFDFCGGGLGSKSEGKSEEMSVNSEVKDLEAVLEYVKSCPDVDTNRISLLGCSQGGFVSAICAVNHPEIENLILFYPAFCIPDDARAGKMLFCKFDPANIPDIICRFPMKIGGGYAKEVLDWNYLDKIADYSGKVILLHGMADNIVDIEYSRKAAKIYTDCHYYEIPDGQHMFRGKADEKAKQILQKEMHTQKEQ